MMKRIWIYMIAALMMAGCVKRVLSPREFISWVEDEGNGLYVEKLIGGHLFGLQYKPSSYEVLMQSHDELISAADFTAMNKEIESLQYFTLTIRTSDQKELALSGAADEEEYAERSTYLMSEMQNDFALIEGDDTLSCVFYHSERNFNLSPENHILLGFEKSDSPTLQNKTLMYYDRLLGCGPVMITIKSSALENIPELKFAQ